VTSIVPGGIKDNLVKEWGTMDLQKSKRAQASFLRWAGSKKQIIPRLRNYWGDGFNRYIEPFAGSASLFFTIEPKKAILGDLNSDLIETLRVVKNFPRDLWKLLHAFKLGKATYYAIRQQDPDQLPLLERAARFIYLNRFCFNGLYRTNQRGAFNVPFGGKKTGDLPSIDILERCSELLKNASLVHGDFETVLRQTRHGDFVYMDPPYRVKAKRVFREYHPDSFNEPDLKRLKRWMSLLDKRNVSFVVSYADSDEGRFLMTGFFAEIALVKRNIAGFSHRRARSTELIISNFTPRALPD
jgi:DNA adenine methylase